VPRAELACGRAGDDGDGMAGQPVRPALRLLLGPAACMATSWCTCMAWGIIPPRASVVVLAPRVMAHVPVGAGGRSCKAETCVGRDLSCRAETSHARQRLLRGDPSCGELVGGAANWSET
jgi:hypothetical protein